MAAKAKNSKSKARKYKTSELLIFPQLKRVYNGEELFVEYSALLEIAISAAFSRSNGEGLLHMSGNVNPYKPPGMIFAWAFHPVNPWRERFDPYLVFLFLKSVLWGEMGV